MSSVTSLTVRCPACGAQVATGGLAPGSRIVCGACRRPMYLPMPPIPGAVTDSSRRMPLPPHLRETSGASPAMAPASASPAPSGPGIIPAEEPSRQRSWIYDWLLIGGIGLGVLVGFAFVIGLIATGGVVAKRQGSGEHLEQVVIVEQQPQEVKWAMAPDQSQVVHKVAAKVEFFEYGPVLTRDDRGAPKPTDDKSYLQVTIKLKNYNQEPLEYHSWYGNQFELDGEILEAELTDDRGVRYPRIVFEGVDSLRGMTTRQNIAYKESLSDVIVFSIPEGVDMKAAKTFRLKLPCGAVGREGWFRLELPSSLLIL